MFELELRTVLQIIFTILFIYAFVNYTNKLPLELIEYFSSYKNQLIILVLILSIILFVDRYIGLLLFILFFIQFRKAIKN